jgi:hypothetical protein
MPERLRAPFDGPRSLENPRLPAANVAIVNDCVLKPRKARANRLRAVRFRGGTRESHETAAESEYGMGSPAAACDSAAISRHRSAKRAIK